MLRRPNYCDSMGQEREVEPSEDSLHKMQYQLEYQQPAQVHMGH